jgi:hypothetical protein
VRTSYTRARAHLKGQPITTRTEKLMSRLFPTALLACIAEGRPPLPAELASLTETIWREAFGLDSPSNSCQRAAIFARVALLGGLQQQEVLERAA